VGATIDVNIDRDAAARYGLNVADVHSVVTAAIGGDKHRRDVEGLQRFPINVRYPRETRDSVEKIRTLPAPHRARRADPSRRRAEVKISEGPPMLKSENARLSAGCTSTSAGAISARRCETCSARWRRK